ncbi:hypothetical protein [Streptomyces sp. CBMA123]|nr:hypothetical protein [Streptomyces sp. CBMA123]
MARRLAADEEVAAVATGDLLRRPAVVARVAPVGTPSPGRTTSARS